MGRHTAQGFTLVEILVALLLLGIVIVAILAPLTGLFGLTQRSTRQMDATAQAQQAMELIRGQWLDPSRYAGNCVVGTLPQAVRLPEVQVQDEDVQGKAQPAPAAFTVGTDASCPAGSSPPSSGPPLRLVSVTASVNGNTSTLQVEVARP